MLPFRLGLPVKIDKCCKVTKICQLPPFFKFIALPLGGSINFALYNWCKALPSVCLGNHRTGKNHEIVMQLDEYL